MQGFFLGFPWIFLPTDRAQVAFAALGPLAVDGLDRRDLNAEARKADIGSWVVGAEPDGVHPEVAQDLGAQSDFTPLRLARVVGAVRMGAAQIRRHARGAVAQVDKRPAPLGL